jgi:hypothetical protein
MVSENNSSGGTSFGTVLLVVFVVLKLVGVITWSWWWVLSPIWISVLLFCALFFFAWLFV